MCLQNQNNSVEQLIKLRFNFTTTTTDNAKPLLANARMFLEATNNQSFEEDKLLRKYKNKKRETQISICKR